MINYRLLNRCLAYIASKFQAEIWFSLANVYFFLSAPLPWTIRYNEHNAQVLLSPVEGAKVSSFVFYAGETPLAIVLPCRSVLTLV